MPRGFYSFLVHFAYCSRKDETPPAKDESWQLLLEGSTRTFALLQCPGLHWSRAHPGGRHEPFGPGRSRDAAPQEVDTTMPDGEGTKLMQPRALGGFMTLSKPKRGSTVTLRQVLPKPTQGRERQRPWEKDASQRQQHRLRQVQPVPQLQERQEDNKQ